MRPKLVTVVVFGGGGWVHLGLKHLNAEPARDSPNPAERSLVAERPDASDRRSPAITTWSWPFPAQPSRSPT
jgi:hypothetical protein